MTTVDHLSSKRVPFRLIKIRTRKPKPVWHDFACDGCGAPTREFSDPRASLYLCDACFCRRLGIENLAGRVPIQTQGSLDWWSLWAMEYESKLAAGLIDTYGRSTEHGTSTVV